MFTPSNVNTGGAAYVLKCKGLQDKRVCNSPDMFDAKRQFLKERDYQVVYTKINTNKQWSTKPNCLRFDVEKTCDLINMIDLVVDNKDGIPINSFLRKIEVTYAGHRMDILNVNEDIETQIRTNASLFGRQLNIINGKMFIPLAMAPFHENNLVFPSTVHHQLTIYVDLHENVGVTLADVDIYGNMYHLNEYDRDMLHRNSHEMVTTQNQYMGVETMCKGLNCFKISYNHPVYMMYFWGFDKAKVKNVRLVLDNDNVFFEGPIEALEHVKMVRGQHDVEPVTLFFSPDKVGAQTKSSINFSRIDNAYLEIETDQEGETPVYIVALSMQTFRYCSGMVGFVYSK